jgi:ABC-2 type transport system ATP-binding protein
VADAPAIETTALSKRYGRGVLALDRLDLHVERGEVFGFLGPNGAGKSTTIRLLLDLIRPTDGRASIIGCDTRRASVETRRLVGYLPGDLRLADRLTGAAQLDSLARLRGVATPLREELCERFGAVLDRPVRELSKGNRQKLGVVQAFMHRPELVIMDEPTTGLDPLLQEEFHAVVRETAADGRTVFLSSHSLDEVQRAADRVGIIRSGRLLSVDRVAALRERALRHVTILVRADGQTLDFASVPGVRVQEQGGGRVVLTAPESSMDGVVKVAARSEVVDFVSAPADLEEIFLDVYRERDGG